MKNKILFLKEEKIVFTKIKEALIKWKSCINLNHLELHLNEKNKSLFKKKLSLRIKNEIKSPEQIHNKVNKLNY